MLEPYKKASPSTGKAFFVRGRHIGRQLMEHIIGYARQELGPIKRSLD